VWVAVWVATATGDGPAERLRSKWPDVFLSQIVNVGVIAVPVAIAWAVRKPGRLGRIAVAAYVLVTAGGRLLPFSPEWMATRDMLAMASDFVAKPLVAVALAAMVGRWIDSGRQA
jgi:hypothetical protein